MKISIDQMTENPSRTDFEAGLHWMETMLGDQWPTADFVGSMRLSCLAHLIGDDLFLEGFAKGETNLECGRCLGRYRHKLSEGFQLVLEPAGDRIPTDPEGVLALSRDGVCLGDELETGWYQGRQIDLGAIFVEVVSLAFPASPLCREECPGLCQHCGVNLSTARCKCEETRQDSPFAILAGLREELVKE
jgi:uncharacterized metal-binding protein YceD (DUF177 family)